MDRFVFLRIQLVCTLLAATSLHCTSSHATLQPFNFSIAEYVSLLPVDLRAGVETAITAERSHANARRFDSGTKCGSEEVDTPLPCPPSKYRQPDSQCNNVRHKHWGARGAPYLRLLKPQYSDGTTQPRQSVTTHSLPSVIDVVDAVQATREEHRYVTSLVGAWGALLLRDIANTEHPRPEGRCCGTTQQKVHSECYARLSPDICVEYIRSVPALESDQCDFEYREQMNTATSFLDGSDIYGSTEDAARMLRQWEGGLVKVRACSRCARHPLYAIMLTEHNRLAVELARLNRHWDDNRLYEEAKNIVIAQIQHITYHEFLPTVLGEVSIGNSDLELVSRGHYSDYSSSNKAGVYNSVSLSALPAFMSMLPSSLINETIDLDSLKMVIESLSRTPAHTMGLRSEPMQYNGPLLLHMGRDHGLPPYPAWLKLCRGEEISEEVTFESLSQYGISNTNIEKLQKLYSHPNDIDLLTGAVLEAPTPGAIVGPTLSCLLKKQFSLLRKADRFWYENDIPPSSLTIEQIEEIRKVTLAGLLCSNVEGFEKVQPKAFVREDPYLNARITCRQYASMNITPWLEMDYMVEVSEDILMEAMEKAQQEIADRRRMEYESWATRGSADPKSSVGTAASFSKANKAALKLANTSLLFEFASNEIINSLQNRRRRRQAFDNSVLAVSAFGADFTDGLQSVDVSPFLSSALTLEPECDESSQPCDTSKPFRTFTGRCNNLRNPKLGSSLTPFARLLPPAYEDSISRPRSTGASGLPLPNPRVVSALIHPDISNLHSRYTLITMQYGQFLDHDITMTPIHKGFHESIPDCRPCDSPRTIHQECDPISIPPGDHYYPEFNLTTGVRNCLPFMRSLPGQLSLGPREQVNQNSAFLDASQVYGENRCQANELKGFGGRLNATVHPIKGKELLPQSATHPECRAPSGLCFIAGDGRASEQPGLAVMHTIFMREHNRIIEGLRGVNPHWEADKLYEHARRIVIAINQHITYNEFLPRILSWNAVNLYGLKLLPQGYYKEYNPNCNPSIVNEFATAAFRIGHSLLRPHIPRMSPNYQVIDPPILLRNGFFKPDMLIQPHMIDEIARGLVSTPMETLDQFVTGEVTNHLFEDRRIPFSGIDLIALNIQRGRDHGIQSYNNYRALCNLKRATSFEDLSREIPTEVIARLKRIYATVDDIDLFSGGMSERPLQGGLVGPTFACIIAIQFRQLRKCDRFWYENDDEAVRFTEGQLTEIRKITLAKVICENLDAVGDMQRAAFDLPSGFLNPRVACQAHPGIDLSAWRESSGQQGCIVADRHVAIGDSAFPSPCTSCVCTNEGMQCASLRVTDCSQLMREWSREAILRDDVCSSQCSFVLRDNPSSQLRVARGHLTTGLTPPAARQIRARQVQFDPFTNFEFPDLTQFIG